MLKIKKIWCFLVFIVVAGCQTVNIPEPYNYKVKELQINPFGCWMEVSVEFPSPLSDIKVISGELLNLSRDSTFLLTAHGVVNRIENRSIVSASLYTHKNQGDTYLLTTGLLIVPSFIGAVANPDWAEGFLSLGIPVFITGITHALIESSKKRNILVYPQKNSLTHFRKFARFPGGIPGNVDLRLLYLKKM